MSFGLLAQKRHFILQLLILLSIASMGAAASSDDLALPVRKGSKTTSKSPRSSEEASSASAPKGSKSKSESSNKTAPDKSRARTSSGDSGDSERNGSEKSRSSASKPKVASSKSSSNSSDSRHSASSKDSPNTYSDSSDSNSKSTSSHSSKYGSKSDSDHKSDSKQVSSRAKSRRSAEHSDTSSDSSSPKSKSKGKATTAKNSDERKQDSDEEEKADMAALDSLRHGSHKNSSEDTDNRNSNESKSESHSSDQADNAADLPVDNSPQTYQAAQLPAPLPPPAPAKRGFFSRLLGLGKTTPQNTAHSQTPFNSDYATRQNKILPAVLDGLGYGGVDLPIGKEDPYRLASLPNTFRPTDLTLIPNEYCIYHNAIYLRREAAYSMDRMIAAAASQGITLRVVSGYRDYNHQMRLYTNAVARGGENQKNVARPGRSEHQLGTTADVTNDDAHALSRSFADTAAGHWLAANAASFGWKMTVVSGSGPRSHVDEPWHIRYLGSAVNDYSRYSVAQGNQQPQHKSLLGSVGRLFGFGRR